MFLSKCFSLCVAHWGLRSFTRCTSWGSLGRFSKLYFRIGPFLDDSRLSKISWILSLAAPHILIKTEAKCYNTFHTYVKIMIKIMWLQGAWKSGACDSGQITLWGHKKSVCYSSANLHLCLFYEAQRIFSSGAALYSILTTYYISCSGLSWRGRSLVWVPADKMWPAWI